MNSLETLEKAKNIEITWKKRTTFYQGDVFSLTLENELIEKIETNLKVWEIIKKKDVYISILKSYINYAKLNGKDFNYNEYETYNYALFSKHKLTQEEFDLIKEWLERE